jgi:curved DNA-binding protein CbpA
MTYQPDRNPAGAEMMKIINRAFEVLRALTA